MKDRISLKDFFANKGNEAVKLDLSKPDEVIKTLKKHRLKRDRITFKRKKEESA